jgi:outer membrane immunogenic protein
MNNTLIGIAAFATIVGTPALAADMALKAPPPPSGASWTGCYLGGNEGWIGSRSSATLSPSGTYLTPAAALAPPNAPGTGTLFGDLTAVTNYLGAADSDFAGGAQVGCNWQVGHLVFGAEADLDGANLKETMYASFGPVTSANPAFTVSSHSDSVTERMDWYSTIRGRVGFVQDQWFIYATGGFAEARFASSTNVSFGSNGTSPVYANVTQLGSAAVTRGGGVIGGGVEYALSNNWTVRAEYLCFSFPGFSYLSPLVAPAGVAPGYTWNTRLDSEHVSTVRVSFNYKFDWIPPFGAR